MTECERLIQEGKVLESFLEPENRECFVPAELKKLWALQIDLVQQVENICKRHGLSFYAIAGTLIGAVRHHGFIPWDDDLDIAIKRDDYNKFIEYAKKELSEPYFLQIPTTDKYFYSPHIWLRNSNSTAIAHGDGPTKCNNGALIHIFPLDAFFDTEDYIRFIKWGRLRNITAHNSYHYKYMKGNQLKRRLLNVCSPLILCGNRETYYKRREQKCTEYSQKPSDLIGIHTTSVNLKFRKRAWKVEDFSDVIWTPFEYYKIPVPVGYHDILTSMYGDYMKFPDESERVYKHSWEIDPDVPYKEYCSKKYGVKY